MSTRRTRILGRVGRRITYAVGIATLLATGACKDDGEIVAPMVSTPKAVSMSLSWFGPSPTLASIWPLVAAPGATVSLYGTNFVATNTGIAPKAYFGSLRSSSVQIVSNSEIRAVVPGGGGSVSVHVETAAGSTGSKAFNYARPTITGITPATALRGTSITITGQNFGTLKTEFNYVKFGKSLVVPTQWTDQKLVVRAPSDFGTGTINDLFTAIGPCVVLGNLSNPLVKWILKMSSLGCAQVIADFKRQYQLLTNPGFLQRTVDLVVYTSAGGSNPKTFTFIVETENR